MRKVLIVSGGNIDTDFGQKWIAESKPDYLMAVDSGMEFFRQVQLVPQKIVGDFDSVRKETLNFFQEQEGIQWKILVPEKDDTDTEHCLDILVREGYKKIYLMENTTHGLLESKSEEFSDILHEIATEQVKYHESKSNTIQ